jgi:hypothetical protein
MKYKFGDEWIQENLTPDLIYMILIGEEKYVKKYDIYIDR